MRTKKIAGTEALLELDKLRKEWESGKEYPFIIGDDEDLKIFQDNVSVPADGGAEIIQLANEFDVTKWLASNPPDKITKWPKKELGAQTVPGSLYDLETNAIKPTINIGFIEVNHPWEIFAKIGFGGTNESPETFKHVAIHKFWFENYQASPLAISDNLIECYVTDPPTERESAIELAEQHYAYCFDIVEQGVGSIGKLASSLLNSKFWYFWWD